MKTLFLLITVSLFANAHFLTLLPSNDNITKKDKDFKIEAMFIHPFEQTGMHMEKPKGIFLNTQKNSLKLEEIKKFNEKAWMTSFDINRPGVYKFFTIPQAYFEPSEGKYISHVPKVIVSAYGREDGWDEPIGLKYEIIPMIKPFSLYAGNSFVGKVLVDGKPLANAEVEVELYNEFALKAPSDAHITQVVKADENGVFTFTMNHKGWWGFAALIEEGEKEYNGKKYPIENGALIWVKAY